jgi:putative addiction module component (TIGR02574 family)
LIIAHTTPEVAKLLEQVLTLSEERGLVIDRLIESLDEEPADERLEEAWAEEIKRRVDDIRSGRTKMIAGNEVRRRLAARLLNAGK